jgi:benzoyl-CoA 2,3-dioxygenase component B
VDRWNKLLAEKGIEFRLRLPHRRFHRAIGVHAGLRFDPDGNLVDEATWARRRDDWLPSASDRAFVQGLMTRPVLDPRQMAGWIAPPRQGIKGRPVDFEYVRHGEA